MANYISISVIIPIYNMGQYLEQCLNSVVNQTLSSIEVICIDDGSTDNCSDILGRYKSKYKEILTIVTQENRGSGPARNKGISLAQGKYVSFLDPDDYYANDNVLCVLYENAERERVNICGGNLITNQGDRPEFTFERSEIRVFDDCSLIGAHVRYIYRRDFLKMNKIEYPDLRRFQDGPFLIKAMIISRTFYAVATDIIVYRKNHKKLYYSVEVARCVLKGLVLILTYCRQYNVNANAVKNVLIDNREALLSRVYTNRTELDSELIELNEIAEELLGIEYGISDELVSQYSEQINALSALVENTEEIYIFGAGKYGIEAIKYFEEKEKKINGILVTNVGDNIDKKIQYPILNYQNVIDKNANIVIALSTKYADEVSNQLIEARYNKTFYWTPSRAEIVS